MTRKFNFWGQEFPKEIIKKYRKDILTVGKLYKNNKIIGDVIVILVEKSPSPLTDFLKKQQKKNKK